MIINKKLQVLSPDPFLQRIKSTVIGEGMLNDGNIYLMKQAFDAMPAGGCIVEIGIYAGLSTNVMLYLLNQLKRNEPFFNCDAWIYEGFNDHLLGSKEIHMDGRPDISRNEYTEYIKNAYINAVQLLSKNRLPHSFHLSSDTFFDKWNKEEKAIDLFNNEVLLGMPISFAYIDGGHSYEQAKNDFLNVSKHLLPGGFILFDDSSDDCKMGSAQLMSELKKNSEFKFVNKNPNYLFRKK